MRVGVVTYPFLKRKEMEINNSLTVSNIDETQDVEIMIEGGFTSHEHSTWIDKEQAIKLIAHLQEQFGI